MSNVLVISNLGRHFWKFGHYDMDVLLKMGQKVDIAANFSQKIDDFKSDKVITHQIDFDRSPFSLTNLFALYQLVKVGNRNEFKLIHVQSPTGGVIGRIAAIFMKTRPKVVYTAHGFHFFKGASLVYWLLFYPVEFFLSFFTDQIITINNEDFLNAKRLLRAKSVAMIHGVGVNLDLFKKPSIEEKVAIREKLGLSSSDFILIFVAELNENKNQDSLISIMKQIKAENRLNVKLLLVGSGELEGLYKSKVKELGLDEFVFLLGHRRDVPELMRAADVVVSSSKREGLPMNLLEGMATGLPLVVFDCRGNRDLVIDGENGYLIKQNDTYGFVRATSTLCDNRVLREKMGQKSLELVKDFSTTVVAKEMRLIYQKLLD